MFIWLTYALALRNSLRWVPTAFGPLNVSLFDVGAVGHG
jgi:hypothetical protein